MNNNIRPKRKYLLLSLSVLLILMIAAGFYLRRVVFMPFKLNKTAYVYIDKTRKFDDVIKQLNEIGLPSEKIFRLLSNRMNLVTNLKTGCYAVTNGMTIPRLISNLRSGKQEPVKVTFNNIRTIEDLCGRIANQLMLDSVTLRTQLSDSVMLSRLGFDQYTIPAMFIPNSYEFYWDISTENFILKMKKEYERFWSDSRQAKAENLNLTRQQVSTLASIVEEEATYSDEYPIIAGLYLNRLRIDMKMEADPTVKFAVGEFGLRRILFSHLETESPYNTYIHQGLPPGPIRIPSIKAIDATLSPQSNNYLFMCAKEDLSGRHNFAATHAEHARNATNYRNALNRKGIY